MTETPKQERTQAVGAASDCNDLLGGGFLGYNDLYQFAKERGLEATQNLLRAYVDAGQPDGFMPAFTSRAMCRAAGAGLDSRPMNDLPDSYLCTTHGWKLYAFMWRLDEDGDMNHELRQR